jgi:hypothetical protein
MKIRFNMEIRGCRWVYSRKVDEVYCPFHYEIGNEIWCSKADREVGVYRKRNPSWCPMMKGRNK